MIFRQINADGAETLNASAVFIPALCGNILHELNTGAFYTPGERTEKLFKSSSSFVAKNGV
jgi:hypothetical protein